ncbi:MAG TPA: type II toxin-antitoxin system Phd/YefM family antitoxin [Chloroflexota bacterium]|nr:type II toxin-antitoxin system Phd/YefM family antitoxin [Chloroflexota bacterium]
MAWQVQEAKQRFSELVQRTLDDGPQTVTRNGKEVVVVIAADEYRRQRRKEENLRFLDFLSTMPEVPEEFLERQRDFPRDVDF